MHDIIAVDGRLAFPPLYDLLRSAQKRVQPSAFVPRVVGKGDVHRHVATAREGRCGCVGVGVVGVCGRACLGVDCSSGLSS